MFGANKDEYAFNYVMNAWNILEDEGKTVNLPNKELMYILTKFKETFVDK
jgi:hypothetical protein